MANKRQWLPKTHPWMPHDYDDDTVYAVRAFASGTANIHQQHAVWSYLMYLTASSEEFADISFRPGPDGERATSFAEGKKFVGQQLRKLLRPELTPDSPSGNNTREQHLTRRQIAQRLRRQKERHRGKYDQG